MTTPFVNAAFRNGSRTLHLAECHLENVCTQGLTFDLDPTGACFGLCRARRLVYVTTSGGPIPEHGCGFGYVASLARDFWRIPEVVCYKSAGIDIQGCDVETELERVREQIRADRAARG